MRKMFSIHFRLLWLHYPAMYILLSIRPSNMQPLAL